MVVCSTVLLEENQFDGMENIKIWSDGGANIRFLLSLQQAQPEIDSSYKFFPFLSVC